MTVQFCIHYPDLPVGHPIGSLLHGAQVQKRAVGVRCSFIKGGVRVTQARTT